MEKVIRNGYVAMLYSPGFGAGWYTWNDEKKLFLLFDSRIVNSVELGDRQSAADIAEKIGKELYGEDDYTCVLGADDLRIYWIPEGEEFEVTVYDGSESINII